MTFDGIYGHDDIKEYLADAVKRGTVSHAYIFCGGNGIGKKTVARSFAKMLTENSVADIIFVTNEHYGIKDRKALSVDTIRAARADVFTRPYLADRKVFILPDADTMTIGAQNALLKVFEEPPAYCTIILTAPNDNAFLPTIRSRAVTMRFAPLSDDVILKYLKDKCGTVDPFVARLCGGSIAFANELAQDEALLGAAKDFGSIFSEIIKGDKRSVYRAISFFEANKDRANILFSVIGIAASDLLGQEGEISGNAGALKIIDKLEHSKRAFEQKRNFGIIVSELMLEAWEALHG